MTQQRVATIVVCALIAAITGAAQEARPAEPVDTLTLPTRVRLTMTNGSRLRLELLRIEPGGLVVRRFERLTDPAWTIPLADVRAAERSRGGSRAKGALKGAGIGAAVGRVALFGWGLVAFPAISDGCQAGGCGLALAS